MDGCEASESVCREQRKADQEAIAMLLEQRNEFLKDSVSNSGASILDIVTYIIIGTATGIIITRGLR